MKSFVSIISLVLITFFSSCKGTKTETKTEIVKVPWPTEKESSITGGDGTKIAYLNGVYKNVSIYDPEKEDRDAGRKWAKDVIILAKEDGTGKRCDLGSFNKLEQKKYNHKIKNDKEIEFTLPDENFTESYPVSPLSSTMFEITRFWGWKEDKSVFRKLENPSGISLDELFVKSCIELFSSETRIFAGGYHNCALFAGGKVKCWGHNGWGQLGIGDLQSRGDFVGEMGNNLPFLDLGKGVTVKTLALGYDHSCAILNDDQIKCWGGNTYGQLGLGDRSKRGDHPSRIGDSLPKVDLGEGRSAKSITAGYQFTCALLDNNNLKCWGYNGHGQLGYGNGIEKLKPDTSTVNLGEELKIKNIYTNPYANHICALFESGNVKCWGYGGYSQLGRSPGSNYDTYNIGDGANEMGNNLPFVELGQGNTVIRLSVGSNHTCAALQNGEVKCWGKNDLGELGIGSQYSSLPNLKVGFREGATASYIYSGGSHNCAIVQSQAECWGYNVAGQLGIGNKTIIGIYYEQMGNFAYAELGYGKTVVDLALGGNNTCAVLNNGRIKCWGFNYYGQLGYGDKLDRGDESNEMGDSLPYVDLGWEF